MIFTNHIFPLLCLLTWADPATWPTKGTSWRQSHCHECETAAGRGHGRAPPPCWPLAPAAALRVRRRWPSGCPRPHRGSGTSSPARWYSAGRHLREGGSQQEHDVMFLIRLNSSMLSSFLSKRSPLLIRPSLDKQPWGWTLVTKMGSSPLLLPRPPATVMPSDSRGSFFTVMCFSLQVTHWDRSWTIKGNTGSVSTTGRCSWVCSLFAHHFQFFPDIHQKYTQIIQLSEREPDKGPGQR